MVVSTDRAGHLAHRKEYQVANPNRTAANAARVQNMDYHSYADPRLASRVARFAREAGFKVRESRYRIGPRGWDQRYQNRVSAYFNEGDAKPDFRSWESAARAELEAGQ